VPEETGPDENELQPPADDVSTSAPSGGKRGLDSATHQVERQANEEVEDSTVDPPSDDDSDTAEGPLTFEEFVWSLSSPEQERDGASSGGLQRLYIPSLSLYYRRHRLSFCASMCRLLESGSQLPIEGLQHLESYRPEFSRNHYRKVAGDVLYCFISPFSGSTSPSSYTLPSTFPDLRFYGTDKELSDLELAVSKRTFLLHPIISSRLFGAVAPPTFLWGDGGPTRSELDEVEPQDRVELISSHLTGYNEFSVDGAQLRMRLCLELRKREPPGEAPVLSTIFCDRSPQQEEEESGLALPTTAVWMASDETYYIPPAPTPVLHTTSFVPVGSLLIDLPAIYVPPEDMVITIVEALKLYDYPTLDLRSTKALLDAICARLSESFYSSSQGVLADQYVLSGLGRHVIFSPRDVHAVLAADSPPESQGGPDQEQKGGGEEHAGDLFSEPNCMIHDDFCLGSLLFRLISARDLEPGEPLVAGGAFPFIQESPLWNYVCKECGVLDILWKVHSALLTPAQLDSMMQLANEELCIDPKLDFSEQGGLTPTTSVPPAEANDTVTSLSEVKPEPSSNISEGAFDHTPPHTVLGTTDVPPASSAMISPDMGEEPCPATVVPVACQLDDPSNAQADLAVENGANSGGENSGPQTVTSSVCTRAEHSPFRLPSGFTLYLLLTSLRGLSDEALCASASGLACESYILRVVRAKTALSSTETPTGEALSGLGEIISPQAMEFVLQNADNHNSAFLVVEDRSDTGCSLKAADQTVPEESSLPRRRWRARRKVGAVWRSIDQLLEQAAAPSAARCYPTFRLSNVYGCNNLFAQLLVRLLQVTLSDLRSKLRFDKPIFPDSIVNAILSSGTFGLVCTAGGKPVTTERIAGALVQLFGEEPGPSHSSDIWNLMRETLLSLCALEEIFNSEEIQYSVVDCTATFNRDGSGKPLAPQLEAEFVLAPSENADEWTNGFTTISGALDEQGFSEAPETPRNRFRVIDMLGV